MACQLARDYWASQSWVSAWLPATGLREKRLPPRENTTTTRLWCRGKAERILYSSAAWDEPVVEFRLGFLSYCYSSSPLGDVARDNAHYIRRVWYKGADGREQSINITI